MENIKILKYRNEKILTTKQLAEIYKTEENNIINNFNNNKDHFEEGFHYYKLTGEELKQFILQVNDIDIQISNMTRTLYLWTERGANHHCKILDTKEAWKQFNVLEETYFMVKDYIKISEEQKLQLAIFNADTKENALLAASELDRFRKKQLKEKDEFIRIQEPKIDFYNAVIESEITFDMGKVAKVLNIKGMGRNNLINFLKDKKIFRNNGEPYQEYVDRGYFKLVESVYEANGVKMVSHKTVAFQKGMGFILKLIKKCN